MVCCYCRKPIKKDEAKVKEKERPMKDLASFVKEFEPRIGDGKFYIVKRKPRHGYKSWWEPANHCKKTIDGMIGYLMKRHLVKEGGFDVYEFDFKDGKKIIEELK